MHSFIETLISLVGLYILFSIANSSIVEVFIQMMNERGKFLKKSLDNFFNQAKESPDRMVEKLYDSKLFKAYAKKDKVPDQIDKKIFSQALMEILFAENDTNGNKGLPLEFNNESAFNALSDDLKKTLNFILAKAKGKTTDKLEYFQNEIEDLFETYMKTVSFWYRKKSKIILGITGFVFALLFNLDSIHFYTVFKADSELRQNYVNFSTELYQKKDNLTLDSVAVRTLFNEQFWNETSKDSVMNVLIGAIEIDGNGVDKQIELAELNVGFLKIFDSSGLSFLMALLGNLLTGLALSFGSTFWFTILKKLIGK